MSNIRGWMMLRFSVLLVVAFGLAMPAQGQDLDALVERVSAYEFGESQADLRTLEARIREATGDAESRSELAAALADALSGDATVDAKRYFCRQLAIVGDASSVPALASVARDPDVGEMAVYALARIDGPEAAAALRTARPDSSAENQATDAINAMLLAAEDHFAVGDDAIAGRVYEKVLEIATLEHQWHAAIRGLAITRGGDEAGRIVALLGSENERTRAFAERLIEEPPGKAFTRAIARELDGAPDDLKARLLAALARRGDSAAVPAITALLLDDAGEAQDAAIRALGQLGDADSARVIAKLLMANPTSQAAQEALAQMRSLGVDDALASLLSDGDEAAVVPLTGVLAARRAYDHADALVPLATGTSMNVQRAALGALAQIGSQRHIEPLVQSLREGSGGGGERTLAAIMQRTDDPSATTSMVIDAFDGAGTDAQRSLLWVLGEVAGERAFEHIVSLLLDERLRTSAIDTLARRWPDDRAMETLLDIASSPQDENEKSAALVGALRLADNTTQREPSESAAYYQRIAGLIQSERHRRTLLRGITRVSHPGVLEIAIGMFDDPALASDARPATLTIAARLGREHRLAALAAVDAVREGGSAGLQESCNRAQDLIERDLDFVVSWMVSGPYSREGLPADQLIPTEFAPETGDRAINWRELRTTSAEMPGRFDLNKQIGGTNHCVYVRTEMYLPRHQKIRLEIGSDDGVKAFIDGKVVLERNVMRGLTLGEDVVEVDLDRGWHTLMLKIAQGNGGWEVACRIRGVDGLHIPGFRSMADPQRTSPPVGAIILFDGQDASSWTHPNGADVQWTIERGRLTVRPGSGSLITREPLGDGLYYVEFMTSKHPPSVRGQARGNSGVYLQGRYEVQVLDSWGDAPAHNRCAGIYTIKAPDAAVANRPGEWQTYLIDFTQPHWNSAGEKTANARLTVWHNGVLVHDDVEVDSSTGSGNQEGAGPAPLSLQDHANLVSYGRMWYQPRPIAWEGPQAKEFTSLIGDDTLDGWKQLGGEAEYRVEDGAIVGQTRPNQPNSFLCTEREYADFVLELEFMVHPELNSGVQIRSNSDPSYQNGRVHGYQIEIDPSQRAWTAGIYEESGRKWLADLTRNEPARSAFKQGQWNQLRVVARADEIQTFLNGVPAGELRDDKTPRGFIGLQVHGVGDRADPLEIRWRDIRIRELE